MKRLDMDASAGFSCLNPTEISVIIDSASSLGVRSMVTLEGTGLTSAVLHQGKCLTTLTQHATVVANATRFTGDRLMPLRTGSRVHLTAFGIIGYALWSSSTLREALAVTAQYKLLLNMKCGPTLSIEGSEAILYFSEPVGLSTEESGLCVEFEVAKVLTFLRDLQIAGFRTSSICLPSTSAEFQSRASALLSCESVRQGSVAQIRFDAAWLDSLLSQANPRTHRACLEACDQLMEARGTDVDLAASVRAMLMNAAGIIPTLPEVASSLCMSARTLRRRLDLMDTSYSQLLDDVRKKLALHYVSSTSHTTEIIAEKLGYSDAANFSHAFKRWTGQAPRQYRAKECGGDMPCEMTVSSQQLQKHSGFHEAMAA
ncbi:AraC family transcriptional regulator [Paraburkholderia aspalathi]|uniref:Transcriptional regulator, AraC family n=1 Tax=Paraburkholderia aspalathi TaxID=1324617 RepID=A0A1I7E9W3_9BURK|nr:AraC family transcriptional regulator [Paraburkholderia aspalathi]SFU20730.1 transcriptional regulator, AraC family [Paraburkholderia aspalathi]